MPEYPLFFKPVRKCSITAERATHQLSGQLQYVILCIGIVALFQGDYGEVGFRPRRRDRRGNDEIKI